MTPNNVLKCRVRPQVDAQCLLFALGGSLLPREQLHPCVGDRQVYFFAPYGPMQPTPMSNMCQYWFGMLYGWLVQLVLFLVDLGSDPFVDDYVLFQAIDGPISGLGQSALGQLTRFFWCRRVVLVVGGVGGSCVGSSVLPL